MASALGDELAGGAGGGDRFLSAEPGLVASGHKKPLNVARTREVNSSKGQLPTDQV